jgi:hypothetical protein
MQNIDMFANAGLGILSQYTENISMQKVNVIPNPNRVFLSGHDDGAHFSNCKGQITIDNCSYEGLMDDPINVHGTCVRIIQIKSNQNITAQFMHHQSIGMGFAEIGDNIGLINHKTMQTLGTLQVKNIEIKNPRILDIEFEGQLPEKIGIGDALENLTWIPDVTIINSRFLSCRARGLLLSTPGKVLIENNYFRSSGTAILIAGDANGWYESGAVKDVMIRNNDFSKYCLANIYQFCEGIISIYPEVPERSYLHPYHQKIYIENNKFNPFDYPVLYASSTEDLKFIGNTIERSTIYPPYHPREFTISLLACQNVYIAENQLIGDVLGKNIQVKEMPIDEIHLENQEDLKLEVIEHSAIKK